MQLSQCNQMYLEQPFATDRAFRDGLSPGQYCTYNSTVRADACRGDSGGPLYFTADDSSIGYVVGIVSFGLSCGKELPSINTRVAYYLDWIEPIVWPHSQ